MSYFANPYAPNQRRPHPMGAVILEGFVLPGGQRVFEVRFGGRVREFRTYSSAISHARSLARREGTTVADLWHGV